MASSSGSSFPYRQLIDAVSSGDLLSLKDAIEKSDQKESVKIIALHAAAFEGHLDICKYLVDELKVDVNSKDHLGETPILHACSRDHLKVVIYLLQKGANPDVTNEKGQTPLHYAAEEGHEELLLLLLSKGVNVDAISSVGTPLQRAASNGDHEVVKILLDHHANPNLTFHRDLNVLLAAISAKSLPCVELLLEAGADPNTAGACGVMPLEIAATSPGTGMIRCLLHAGADPNVLNEEELKPAELAALGDNREGFQLLFPVTTPVPLYSDWSYDGIRRHANSKEGKLQWDLKVKRNIESAKSKGNAAFQKKDYLTATSWYTKAIVKDPTNATLLSNRSICWARQKLGEPAMTDAMACIMLRPQWPKAYYRAGVAWSVMKKYDEAAISFLSGLNLDPENKELQSAYQEAMSKSLRLRSFPTGAGF